MIPVGLLEDANLSGKWNITKTEVGIVQNDWIPFNAKWSSGYDIMDIQKKVSPSRNEKITSVTLKIVSHKYKNTAYYIYLT